MTARRKRARALRAAVRRGGLGRQCRGGRGVGRAAHARRADLHDRGYRTRRVDPEREVLQAEAKALRRPEPAEARAGRRTGERHGSRSEEHTSELQSLMRISYAVFCLKKKIK